MPTVNIGGREVTIQEFSGRRAIRTARVLKTISEQAPAILQHWVEFIEEYREEHKITLSRARAKLEFPGQLDDTTDADWEASGNELVLPKSPSALEVTVELFPMVIDLAEEEMAMLLAIGQTSNEQLAELRRSGGNDAIDAHLRQLGDELLDTWLADELLKLAVVMAELIEHQFADQWRDLQDSVGPLLRLLGISRQAQTDQPTEAIVEPTTIEVADRDDTTSGDSSTGEEPATTTPSSASGSDSPTRSDGRSQTPSTVTAGESSPTPTPA